MYPNRHAVWGARVFPSDVRQVFDHLFQNETTPAASQWSPRVDIKEEAQRFVLFVDVPGVDPASIEISMDKGTLSIKGERAMESSENSGEQSGAFTRTERLHGSFNRRFALPDSADAEGITAIGKHGVLEIVIPKKANTAPRRIAINTAH